MKKPRPEIHRRPIPRGVVLLRLLVCKSVQGVLHVAIAQAGANRDKDMKVSLQRVLSLLDHEMRSFLELGDE